MPKWLPTLLGIILVCEVFGVEEEDVSYLIGGARISIPLIDIFNLYQVGRIQIGTPPRTYTLMFDTGSTLTWFRDSNCRLGNSPLKCEGRQQYSQRASRTSQRLSEHFRVHYDDGGEVEGPMFKDRMWLSPQQFSPIQIHFGSATQLDSDTNQRPYDGIIGLGFNNNGKVENVVTTIEQQLYYPIIVYWLGAASNAPNSIEHGNITFGGLPPRCGANALFTPLISTKDLRFGVREVWANGQRLEMGGMEVSSDTGTSALLVPRRVFGRLMQAWGLSENLGSIPVVNCSIKLRIRFQLSSSPNHSLVFTDEHLLLRYGRVCALQAAPVDADLWLFGAPTQRAYCQLFDVGRRRLGFSKLVE